MTRGRRSEGGDAEDLGGILERIDGRGYKAYRDIEGRFALDGFELYVDRAQSDPFAAPSKLRIRMPMDRAELPRALFATPVRRVALQDFVARGFAASIRGRERSGGTGKSGLIEIDAGGQEVLERTAVVIDDDGVEVRFEVGLPATGRRVLGHAARRLLLEEVPRLAEACLRWRHLPHERAHEFVECVENQEHIRQQLGPLGLVAFVGNGAILPRRSGASDEPLCDGAIAFASPPTLEVTVAVANPVPGPDGPVSELRGMGVPEGVTLIVGGGYHGKSTLLDAIERAVYPHIPGDGRETVVSSPSLVKIRAEDGRSVQGVDISLFIGALPAGRETTSFTSEDASGSTSQAASIVEAIEAGATGLLLDEDTSATNFMVRDARMQALVQKEHEPITPFVDRVRSLHEGRGISTVLVMGGCGDYFDVADQVVCMREYRAFDVTEEALAVARALPSVRVVEATRGHARAAPRRVQASSVDPSRGRSSVKISARSRDSLQFGTAEVDLRAVTQLVDVSQTRAVGYALLRARDWMEEGCTVAEWLDALDAYFDEAGLDGLDPSRRGGRHPGNFARPRRFEIAAALNRLRRVRVACDASRSRE